MKLNFKSYKNYLSKLSFGKRVNDSIYVYKESLNKETLDLSLFVELVIKQMNISNDFNVIKFFKSQFKISFLNYPDFIDIPHPVLQKSKTVNLSTGKINKFDYSKSKNPPILHRKETLLIPGHPLIRKFASLTKAEENEGLYKNTKIIGFKKNWEKMLNDKGLTYKGHKLITCEKTSIKQYKTDNDDINIQRHKTAIARYDLSKPIKTIFEYNILQKDMTIFDYGCGQGDDVRSLKSLGYNAYGWDPIFRSKAPKIEADIVNLGFVINIIEDEIERAEVLYDAFSYSKKLLIVSSMIMNSKVANQWKPYKDGIITSRGTFQKYFYQKELGQYIEDVLDTPALAIGPGIYYIFKNPKEHQYFLSKRSKTEINWEQISKKILPPVKKSRKRKVKNIYDNNQELLNSFWQRMLNLGRLPVNEEFERYDELKREIGSAKKAKQIFINKYGETPLNEAFEQRRNDLLVYMALSNFNKKVPYKNLPKNLQLDIKTFVGTYKKAFDESRALLFSTGNSKLITQLCNETSFGVHDHKALYLHKTLIEQLNPILRIYVGCAEILYGDIKNIDIVKIHKKSGKVTLLKYDDFDGKDLPELLERIKVNLKKQRIDIFDHQENANRIQLLYHKICYVGEDHPNRKKWEKISKKLIDLGIKQTVVIGPTKKEYIEMIKKMSKKK